jgi:hypothetical protein
MSKNRRDSHLRVYCAIRKISSFAQIWKGDVNAMRPKRRSNYIPVSERTLKKELFPTFGRPGGRDVG